MKIRLTLLACLAALALSLAPVLLAEPAPFAPPPTPATPATPALKTEKFQLGAWEDGIGYRQAVRVGRTLYISGSVGAGDMPAAIRQAYATLAATLKHHGLTFAHVVKENIYTTKLDDLKAHLDVRRAFYGQDFPAATWVQVARLYEPADVIEVELIAVFPE